MRYGYYTIQMRCGLMSFINRWQIPWTLNMSDCGGVTLARWYKGPMNNPLALTWNSWTRLSVAGHRAFLNVLLVLILFCIYFFRFLGKITKSFVNLHSAMRECPGSRPRVRSSYYIHSYPVIFFSTKASTCIYWTLGSVGGTVKSPHHKYWTNPHRDGRGGCF